jgi:O-methyltransferase
MKKIFVTLIFYSASLIGSLHTINEDCHLPSEPGELYIDLIKRVITNTIYEDKNIGGSYDKTQRENGRDWPTLAHTMVGIKRLNNIHFCMKDVLERNIPGDFVETGVWRGGSTILMRAILQTYGIKDRMVWVCDSFMGFPPPDVEKYPADKAKRTCPIIAVSLEQVQENFSKYGLLDSQVQFLKGFFRDSLPTAPIEKIAVLRLDGDLYESTMDALINLYPKLSIGGYIIIDDLCIPACVEALMDYRKAYGIDDPIEKIDWTGGFWKKTK